MKVEYKPLCQGIFLTFFLAKPVVVEKRLLLADPDVAASLQQMSLEMQKLRAEVSMLTQTTSGKNYNI